MPGIWVKQMGRVHDCREENRDVLTNGVAATHEVASIWMCGCGRFWTIVDDGDGIHRWMQQDSIVDDELPQIAIEALLEDPEWRFR